MQKGRVVQVAGPMAEGKVPGMSSRCPSPDCPASVSCARLGAISSGEAAERIDCVLNGARWSMTHATDGKWGGFAPSTLFPAQEHNQMS